jgi:mRNA-degrading endonuclease YafQ of YafQ-DinJ toxin-antitoxin module
MQMSVSSNEISYEKYLSCCQLLEVDPLAEMDQIKRIYRTRVKMFHPDKNQTKTASDQFRHFQNAYDGIQLFRRDNKAWFASQKDSFLGAEKVKEVLATSQSRKPVKSFLKDAYVSGKMSGERKGHVQVEKWLLLLNFILTAINLLAVPPILVFYYQVDGIWLSLAWNAVFFFFTVAAIRNRHQVMRVFRK